MKNKLSIRVKLSKPRDPAAASLPSYRSETFKDKRDEEDWRVEDWGDGPDLEEDDDKPVPP